MQQDERQSASSASPALPKDPDGAKSSMPPSGGFSPEVAGSPELLRAIADYGYDWEFWIGANGELLWVNPAVERVTGYTQAECFGLDEFPLGLVHERDRARVARSLEGARQGTSGNDVEFSIIRKDGTATWVAASWLPIVGSGGTLSGYRVSIRDISERKSAEEELTENRRQLSTLLSNLPGMAYRCANTEDWPMQFVSDGCRELTGYEPEALTSGEIPYGHLIHPEDRALVWKGVQDGVTSNRQFQIQYRIIDRSGKERWVWEQGRLVQVGGGEAALEGFITDVTARVSSESALRSSEEQYRMLVEQSLQGLVILQGVQGRLVFANPVVEKVTGYTVDELLGADSFEILLPPGSEHLKQRYAARMRGEEEPPRYEAMLCRKDGSIIWVDIAAARINFRGEPAVQLVLMDITARKHAELELWRRDAILQALGEVAEKLLQIPELSDAIYGCLARLGVATQVDRICVYGRESGNEAVYRCRCVWTAGEPEEGAGDGRGGKDIPCDDPTFIPVFDRLAEGAPVHGGASEVPEALRIRMETEGVRSICAVPIFVQQVLWGFVAFHSSDASRRWSPAELDAVHAVAGTLGAAVERSEARRALQKSEAFWRSLVNNLSNVVFTLDRAGTVTFVNRPLPRFLREHMLGRSLSDFLRSEETTAIALQIDHVLRSAHPITREVRGHGETDTVWYTLTLGPVRDGDVVIGLTGVMTEVTEQRRAAIALRRSEEKFRNIVQLSPMGVHLYRLEADGRLVFEGGNPAADRILGTDNSQFIGMTIEDAFPSLAATEIPERYRQAARDGATWQTDEIRYEDGRISGAYEVVAFQTTPNRVAIMFLDVTERSRTHAALAESEERFRQAFHTSPDAVAITRVEDGVYVDINEGFASTSGYARDELVGKSSLEAGIWVDPSARAYMVKCLRERGRMENLETEFRRKDGSTLVGLMSASLLMLDGRPHVLSITRDIQELKDTQEALRREMERAQMYLDVAATVMMAFDADTRILMVNRKGADLIGLPEENVVGRVWVDEFVPQEDREMVRATFRRFLAGGMEGLDYYENYALTATGERRLIAWYLTAVRNPDGGISSILASGIDITERRRMEDDLQRTHEQLAAEHEALQKKNIALREVLNQIEGEKEGVKRLVLDNIERDILPTLQRLRAMSDKPQQALFEVLEDGLGQISSEFASGLREQFRNLTPRQVQICRLIKNGYTSKEIAESLGTSLLTVHKHREAIRDKLGLKNRDINLNSYLQSL